MWVVLVPVRSADCFPDEDTLRPPFLLVRAESGSTPPARALSKIGFFRSRSVMDVGGAHVLAPAPIPAPTADDAFTLMSASPPLSTERRPTVRASHSSMLARAVADFRGLEAFSSCEKTWDVEQDMNEMSYLDEVTLAPPRAVDPAIRASGLAREIHESTEMRHGAARQCTVTVSPFEYAHDPTMCVHIGQPACLASKSVVETDGYLPVVPRHRGVLMLTSIEPATTAGGKRIDANHSGPWRYTL